MSSPDGVQSIECNLFKFNRENKNVKRIATSHDDIGDICSLETTINCKRTVLVSVYIFPNTPFERIKEFFVLNLMAYSPKLKGIFEVLKKYNNHDLPMIVGGNLNLDLRGSHGTEFIEFMRTELGLELSNDIATSSSRNSTCIDILSIHREA
ncbi:unnamed protein product [Macrosiphum euphorbiae]|uniref:Endonuclease/exonuclease/phosphatase domain-containing protein n=1 Tax=Macrosiphum euphorbiae TaxID=13131 RepID=A0AAV0W4E6_9HEMI|nr:unnamed protein product [Macrosiphum euphorbiae]